MGVRKSYDVTSKTVFAFNEIKPNDRFFPDSFSLAVSLSSHLSSSNSLQFTIELNVRLLVCLPFALTLGKSVHRQSSPSLLISYRIESI